MVTCKFSNCRNKLFGGLTAFSVEHSSWMNGCNVDDLQRAVLSRFVGTGLELIEALKLAWAEYGVRQGSWGSALKRLRLPRNALCVDDVCFEFDRELIAYWSHRAERDTLWGGVREADGARSEPGLASDGHGGSNPSCPVILEVNHG